MDSAILKKICCFCIYQERTHQEVRSRLAEWKVFGNETEEILTWLITENFVNEERFAKVFAGSKFRVKKWGRLKILFELKGRKLSPYCINMAMKEIPDDDYQDTIKDLIEKKQIELGDESNELLKKQKIAKYIIGKGYEANLVWDIIKSS